MRKLSVFNFITLNGFYKGLNEDISWHQHSAESEEENEFNSRNANSGNVLLLGRVTYEMMAGFWPSPMAFENFPMVAEGINKTEKIVFSKKLKKADWNNTRIIKDNIAEEIRKIKQSPGNDLTILGSGSITTQLSDAGLIDEYQFMVDPTVMGAGTSIFEGIKHKLDLKLITSKTFKSGRVVLTYEPLK